MPVMHCTLFIDGKIAAMFSAHRDAAAALALAKREADRYLAERDKEIRDDDGHIVWTPTWEPS